MNDSPSTISPAWPTHWPKNSFPALPTALLALVIVAPFVLTAVLAVVATTSAPAPATFAPRAVDISIVVTFFVEAVLALAALFALPRLSGFSLAELGFRVPTAGILWTALLGGVLMAVVANGSASLLDTLLHAKHEQQIVQVFSALRDPHTIVVFALFAILFAPVAEETIFRVFFFNLGFRYGGFWTGAILSGALFGLAHGDLYAAFPLALGGIILCAVYYRTRNAYASMISHAFFNALSIVALLYVPQLTH